VSEVLKKLAKKYRTPEQVQKFLRGIEYNREKSGETLRSAIMALKHQKAHCFEAAFIAAAILELNGYPPIVVSMESQDGLDHVIFVYRDNGKWGAVARSRDQGLNGRAPIFRSLRDLVWSYYDPYVDGEGKVTAYQLAHLDDTKSDWRYSRKNVWKAENYLLKLPHRKLKSSEKRYQRVLKIYLEKGPLTTGPGWW